MTIAGIVFDKDGTLFDFDKTWAAVTKSLIEAESLHHQGNQMRLAQALGFDMENTAFLPESIVIASTSAQVADAILPFTADKNKNALLDRMTQATANAPQVQAADLKPLFANLQKRGIALGIATNDSEIPARANISQAGVLDVFDFIAGFDSGFGGKPEIGQLIAFCDHVNLKPNQCVMVGDSLHDLHAGSAAGMRTIGVLTGPASRTDLTPHADVVLDTIADIPAWLDSH
jgi:phosphoglycolate phosphatase